VLVLLVASSPKLLFLSRNPTACIFDVYFLTVMSKVESSLIDSLPYVDELNEQYEQYALSLIEEEMKRMATPRGDWVPKLTFRTTMMQKEWKKRVAGETESFIAPSVKRPSSGASLEEWKETVKRARTAYEAERIRSICLEVDKDQMAGIKWKLHNEKLGKLVQAQKVIFAVQQKKVQDINQRRQQSQTKSGQQLKVLEIQYQELVAKQQNLKSSIAQLVTELSTSQG
jgi:hypothetical protein